MRIKPLTSLSAIPAVLAIVACSPGNDDAMKGSVKYRLINENQFLIEASGHWVTSDELCDGQVTKDGLRDIKLSAQTVLVNGGQVKANWQQVEDLERPMRQVKTFASRCASIDEHAINVAFLTLSYGVMSQTVAMSEQRHMFIIDADDNVTYWKLFQDVDLSSLKLDEDEESVIFNHTPKEVNHALGDLDGRFEIEG